MFALLSMTLGWTLSTTSMNFRASAICGAGGEGKGTRIRSREGWRYGAAAREASSAGPALQNCQPRTWNEMSALLCIAKTAGVSLSGSSWMNFA